jgi:hypothetical protein
MLFKLAFLDLIYQFCISVAVKRTGAKSEMRSLSRSDKLAQGKHRVDISAEYFGKLRDPSGGTGIISYIAII